VFRLAHLSDPHLPMPQARPSELLGKRLSGYANWWRHRVHLHRPEALAAIVRDISDARPDHIALTGDVVNVSLEEEFRRAARWLAELAPADRLSLVPGNHDAYVPQRWDRALGGWAAWMAGDGGAPPRGPGDFPFLRRRGPIALVGLTTALPTPTFFATGRLGGAQIERCEEMLRRLGAEGLYRVVLIHHPPLAVGSRHKRLSDVLAFQAMLRRVGCELILHGHTHRSEVARLDGPAGPVPVLGVTSASAAVESRYGRARWHLIEIERAGAGWQTRVAVRAARADGACEDDGRYSFRTA